MKKFTNICSELGLREKQFVENVDFSEINSKYIDGELYVDENDFYEKVGFNTPIPHSPNLSVKDILYFDNIGLTDGNVDNVNHYVYILNQFINKLGNNYEVFPLMKYTSLVTFKNGLEINNSFIGFGGKYKEYVTHLIDIINGIDLSSIDVTDVFNFELSDERKIFSTQKINVVGLKPNEKTFSINEEDFINYLLHILPQYLPSDVKFHPSVIGIINDDEDDVSIEFRDMLWKKSHQYLLGMKTKVNSVDLSKIDLTKIRVS